MRTLNVIDLDKTLISIDSFREFTLKYMNIKIFFIVLSRLFKLIDRKTFAQNVTKELEKHLNNEKEVDEFTAFLHKKINNDILEAVKRNSGKDSLTLLLSSSPRQYVKKFALSLGFEGLGSYWRGNEFFHCYGENKIKLLNENYPQAEYNYNFAVSDDENDTDLLKMFRHYQLYKGSK